MDYTSGKVIKLFLALTLLNTLAASFIWGINTLFLLNAGLTNTEAFTANAFFTAGQVFFEIPTGVIADTRGRRFSFLLGCVTLIVATLCYLWMWKISGPFIGWAVSSILLGLGFTFFSGATEAWLVDALTATNYQGPLDGVFGLQQIVTGVGMLVGSIAGGVIAQYTNLGVPYLLRTLMLVGVFLLAYFCMFDKGFIPDHEEHLGRQVKKILANSLFYGLRKPACRWIIFAGPFTAGVGIYAFYALQPFLLNLYGDPTAYGVAGVAAGVVASAQILGGLLVPYTKNIFTKRTDVLFIGAVFSASILIWLGAISHFWVAITLITLWAIIFAITTPVRQAYINGIIPSQQRATVLSFDSMMSSSGGVIFQPILGKVADAWSYSASYVVAGLISVLSWPFILLAKSRNVKADNIK